MSGSLIDNPNAGWVVNGVNAVLQTDLVEGAAVGASHGGVGNSNAGAQVLANRTALLYQQQQTDKADISALLANHFANMQAFTSSGTFTVPSLVTALRVMCVGGGGGGAGATNSPNGYGGAGGGGGGTAIGIYGVTPGQQISVTVGNGGSGGTSGSSGAPGGASSVGSFCSASGGTGGAFETTDLFITPGGNGSGGTLNLPGGLGGTPIATGPTTIFGGAGGSTAAGAGQALSALGIPSDGQFPGGGASAAGGAGGASGGNGAAGLVLLEW